MPRRRRNVQTPEKDVALAEKKLKLFRQWMAAEREALAFRDMMRARAEEARAAARRGKYNRHMGEQQRRESPAYFEYFGL